jgi:hypothetical protein
MFLHIIVLQKDKLFLHISTHNEENETTILLECELINDYASIYKPIRILDTVVIFQEYEVDFFVKKYMNCYDMDNVRGGSYTNEILNENERQYILHELTHTLDMNELQCDIISDIVIKYNEINTWSIDKIKLEYKKCKKYHNNYENEKQMLHNFTVGRQNTAINRIILADLKWLSNECIKAIKLTPYIKEVNNKPYEETETIKKYKNIVIKLKSIYTMFTNYMDVTNTYQPLIHLYSPETILDQYFYNPSVIQCILHYEDLNIYLSMCEYMSYCIICRIDEYEFDVKSYPSNFEMSNKYEIAFLEKHINECLPKSCGIVHQS